MKHASMSIVLITLVALMIGGCVAVQPEMTTRQTELHFVTHLAAGMPEQDVYVTKAANSGEVYRITADEAEQFMDAPVYAAGNRVEHDPFVVGENPIGPYAMGNELDLTMGEWLAGTGSGTYTISGDQAEMDLEFQNLVPNSTYTLWCSTTALPPVATIIDEPCGAADGSENTFATDDNGAATFQLMLRPLPYSTDQVLRVIALAYHSDGKTHGHHPGDFGLNSHVQIFAAIPGESSEVWQTTTEPLVARAR